MKKQGSTAKILKDLETGLKAKGERLTDPRRKVMAVLLDGKDPLKAYDIVGKLKGMKPMSVYRALDFLAGRGFAHRIESLNAYVPCVESHCAHKDSQYLICDDCGTVEELHNHDIDNYISKNLARSGFRVSYKSMELHGICRQCA
ncbi:MAG: transcriptional repressor [Alphaproteobacteria bacterium]|nr:transcriptional repressor [Alphaproteobacteria bacterium]